MTTREDLIAVKRGISLVRSGADVFESLGMNTAATALRNYMSKHEPIVEQVEEDTKPNAEIIILPIARKERDDETD